MIALVALIVFGALGWLSFLAKLTAGHWSVVPIVWTILTLAAAWTGWWIASGEVGPLRVGASLMLAVLFLLDALAVNICCFFYTWWKSA